MSEVKPTTWVDCMQQIDEMRADATGKRKGREMPEGRKDDSGKLRFDLIPVGPLEELVLAYTLGANRYGDRNWENGLTFGRLFGALMRHAWTWWRGQQRTDDGLHPLASVAFCAFALMELEQTHSECDDRPRRD